MRRRARRYALYENPADYRQRGQWRNVVETTAGSLDGLVADRPFGRVVATRRLEPASECDTEGIASLITFVPPGFPEARRGLHPGAGAGMIARFEQQTAVRLKPEDLEARARDTLVQHLQIVFETVSYGRTVARIELGPHHLAPNGYLHGGTVVSLADTSCGYGTIASLPDGAESFTTIELKTNFLGTAREGTVYCEASLAHDGRSTQAWNADVRDGDGNTVALFRCTQMLLYPRAT